MLMYLHTTFQGITSSEEVLRTKTQYSTSTIRILQGNQEYETTLVEPVGVTTITDYKLVTSSFPSLPPVPSNLPPPPLGPLTLAPTYTTLTSAITYSTVVTQTDTQEYRILFRARPITTTVLSTRRLTTVITSISTQTVALPPLLGAAG